jgi:hypothetical protein
MHMDYGYICVHEISSTYIHWQQLAEADAPCRDHACDLIGRSCIEYVLDPPGRSLQLGEWSGQQFRAGEWALDSAKEKGVKRQTREASCERPWRVRVCCMYPATTETMYEICVQICSTVAAGLFLTSTPPVTETTTAAQWRRRLRRPLFVTLCKCTTIASVGRTHGLWSSLAKC